MRKTIPLKFKHEVLKRDNYRCLECGTTNKETKLEIDHIIPISRGGTDELSNLQTLCKDCNLGKNIRIWKSKSNFQKPCDFSDCKNSANVHVIMDDDESYDLCLEHLNYEVEDMTERFGKGKIYKDYAKQIISLGVPV